MGGSDSSEPGRDGLGSWFLSALTQTARPLVWLLLSLVLAVGACSWAITNRLAARRADVTQLYARSASHVGQEVEKRVAAYVNVGRALANVTKVQVALDEERRAAEQEREAVKSESATGSSEQKSQLPKKDAPLAKIQDQITELKQARERLLAADASTENAAHKLDVSKRAVTTTKSLVNPPALPTNVSPAASAEPPRAPESAPAQKDAIPAFEGAISDAKKLLSDPTVVKEPDDDTKKAIGDLNRSVVDAEEVSRQTRSIRSASSGYTEAWRSCQAEQDPATCFGRKVLPTLSLPKASRIEIARCVWNDATSVLFDPLTGRVAIPAGEYVTAGTASKASETKKSDDAAPSGRDAAICLWIPFSELLDKAAPANATDGDLRFAQTLLVDGRTGAALANGGIPFVQAVPGFDGKTAVAPRVLENVEIGGAAHRAFLQPVATRFSPYRACPASKPECNDTAPWRRYR